MRLCLRLTNKHPRLNLAIDTVYCDLKRNRAKLNQDEGDCCEETCIDVIDDCSVNGYDHKTPNTESKYLLTKEYSESSLIIQCDRDTQAGYTIGYYYTLTCHKEDLDTKCSNKKDMHMPT